MNREEIKKPSPMLCGFAGSESQKQPSGRRPVDDVRSWVTDEELPADPLEAEVRPATSVGGCPVSTSSS